VDSACAARECQSVPGKDAVGDAWHATRAGEDAARCALVPPDVRGGERVQGSREIARALDRVRPEPPLFPADPDESAEVEQAERWGDEVLQPVARRVLWNGMRRDRSSLRSYSAGARLGIPIGLAVRTAAPIVALSARFDEPVREDLAALPGMLKPDRRLDRRRGASRGRARDADRPRLPGPHAARPARLLARAARHPGGPVDRSRPFPPARPARRRRGARAPGRGACRRAG
jgi:hypothetical protein